MLVPLVNFSSSFRFRVRQSCAAVSLRLSQSKTAWTRLSAWRRHSCRTAAAAGPLAAAATAAGPLAPRFGARSAAAAAGMLSCWVLSSHLLFLQCGAQCARGEPRSLQQPRYAAPASPRCSTQWAKFAKKVHKRTLGVNIINFELDWFNASIWVPWDPSDSKKSWYTDRSTVKLQTVACFS